jgi:capsule polysaccharide export protein KpsE/RkpR
MTPMDTTLSEIETLFAQAQLEQGINLVSILREQLVTYQTQCDSYRTLYENNVLEIQKLQRRLRELEEK